MDFPQLGESPWISSGSSSHLVTIKPHDVHDEIPTFDGQIPQHPHDIHDEILAKS
jgi:hypothetical protein